MFMVIFIPILVSYIVASFVPYPKDTIELAYQPPPIAFSIIWPMLYFAMGYAAYLAPRSYWPFYGFLLFALVSWQVTFPKNKQAALYSILIACCTTLTLCLSNQPYQSKMLLAPLLTWLVFAAKMNADIISQEEKLLGFQGS